MEVTTHIQKIRGLWRLTVPPLAALLCALALLASDASAQEQTNPATTPSETPPGVETDGGEVHLRNGDTQVRVGGGCV